MTPENVSDPIQIEPGDFAISLNKDQTAMLWQLLNTRGAGVPFAAAVTAGALYQMVELAAKHHGCVLPNVAP